MKTRSSIARASSVVSVLLFGQVAQAATTYYVATSGDDENPGTSTAPFKTIQRGADVVEPGDTVLVRPGVYADTDGNGDVVTITQRGGGPGRYVTFRSEIPGARQARWKEQRGELWLFTLLLWRLSRSHHLRREPRGLGHHQQHFVQPGWP